jgi:cholesterol oxidase
MMRRRFAAGTVAAKCLTMQPAEVPKKATAWLSQGLEVLQCELAEANVDAGSGRPDFDVLLVGSGYGGAVAANRLSQATTADRRPLSICVLERGREYLPGMFPSRMADLAGHVRFNTPVGGPARGRLEGLFDVRVGRDMHVVMANGLGGGSLINAGVMLFPEESVWRHQRWPKPLRSASYAELRQRALDIQKRLGARPLESEGPTATMPAARWQAMQGLGAKAVPLTLAQQDGVGPGADVAVQRCVGCGDCFTGCNHGAKLSLDVNLLHAAAASGRVRIITGATVHKLQRAGHDRWAVQVWHTDRALRERMAGPVTVTASHLILAAGALGSTELLLRSQTPSDAGGLRFSSELGSHFSGNGDAICAISGTRDALGAVADEHVATADRAIGPTITAMARLKTASGHPFVVQDLATPGPLRRLFEEATTTAALLQSLDSAEDPDAQADPCAVNVDKVERSMAVALIGHDTAGGCLTLVSQAEGLPDDSGVAVQWKEARNDAVLSDMHKKLREQARMLGADARVLPNPGWQMLSDGVEKLLKAGKGPLLTVHPLGGCSMGDDRNGGVVDSTGRVFDAAAVEPNAVHHGLYVLDGAIVPTSLGVNPALTIATLADRAMDELVPLIARHDLSTPRMAVAGVPKDIDRRPVFRPPPAPTPAESTKVQLVERLAGPVTIGARPCWLELTLIYEPAGTKERELRVACINSRTGARSQLRIFARQPPKFVNDESYEREALFVAPVAAGSLKFLHPEPVSAWRRPARRWRAWWAWLRNRGARDAVQAWQDKSASGAFMRSVAQSFALASRAGQVRLFDYTITLGVPTRHVQSELPWPSPEGAVLTGQKRFTYGRRSNPWQQLMTMHVEPVAGLQMQRAARLELDLMYFVNTGVPLLRIAAQPDQPTALADLAGLLLYLMRVMVSVHLWSFRKPDAPRRKPGTPTPKPRDAQRLPRALSRLPQSVYRTYDVPVSDEHGGRARLTQYGNAAATRRHPVLMIHGYSANGTTFAHDSLKPSLAEYLWQRGIEPWVVDLRSSSGMSTPRYPWRFEDIALGDLPAAVAKVCEITGHERIDVVSHCMGSAMFAMGLLADDPKADQMLGSLRRWVMSQAGPRVRFAPANVMRAYLLRWVMHLFPQIEYDLRPGRAAPGVSGDMFDRLVATLPYLRADGRGDEFDIENPPLPRGLWQRTPWVGTRHRLDALIGRTFDARTLAPETLECIDDFFGPISLVTMAQTIHIARRTKVTNALGSPSYTSDRLARLKHVPMLGLHAVESGLVDVETAEALQEEFAQAHLDYRAQRVQCSHQDLMLGGLRSETTFACIDRFLLE